MKRYTLTIADGKGGSREIKVRLDDETSRLLKEAGDPELTRAYIIEEYKARNAERKETRRHVSLDKCMEHGWDIADGRADTESIAERRERDALLYAAMTKLLPQQREVIKQVYYEGKTVTELAKEYGVSKAAVSIRLKKIYIKLKKVLEKGLTK